LPDVPSSELLGEVVDDAELPDPPRTALVPGAVGSVVPLEQLATPSASDAVTTAAASTCAAVLL
jgi:hypothetical protein